MAANWNGCALPGDAGGLYAQVDVLHRQFRDVGMRAVVVEQRAVLDMQAVDLALVSDHLVVPAVGWRCTRPAGSDSCSVVSRWTDGPRASRLSMMSGLTAARDAAEFRLDPVGVEQSDGPAPPVAANDVGIAHDNAPWSARRSAGNHSGARWRTGNSAACWCPGWPRARTWPRGPAG